MLWGRIVLPKAHGTFGINQGKEFTVGWVSVGKLAVKLVLIHRIALYN